MPDALRSWNDRAAKAAILGFVRPVTAPGDVFGPPAERIAAFDNDGTLRAAPPPRRRRARVRLRRRVGARARRGGGAPGPL